MMNSQNAFMEHSEKHARLRVVIADDEPLARSRLVRLCQSRADLCVVAEAECGSAAIAAIRTHRPDLILLDIELRDMNGFDVLRSFAPLEQPRAIMITAHAEHALKAFESNAVDYLTKPIDVLRFAAAIERAYSRCAEAPPKVQREIVTGGGRAANGVVAHDCLPRRLAAEKAHRLYFIDIADVEYIQSEGNYVKICTEVDSYIARNSLHRLTAALSTSGFMRIERSVLINLRRVTFAERAGRGCFAFTLRSGKRVISSVGYRKAVLEEIRRCREFEHG